MVSKKKQAERRMNGVLLVLIGGFILFMTMMIQGNNNIFQYELIPLIIVIISCGTAIYGAYLGLTK